MSTLSNPTPPNRNAPSPVFGAVLMGGMVGIIATAVNIVMYGSGWINAMVIGGVIAAVVAIALIAMLRRPLPPLQESADAFAPLAGARTGKAPARSDTRVGAQAQPRTSLEAATSAGAAGGGTEAAKPAVPGVRDARDPAERPLPGAGGPVPTPPVASPPEGAVPEAHVGDPVVAVPDAPSARDMQDEDDGADVARDAAPAEADRSDPAIPGSGDQGGVDPAMPGPAASSEAPRASEAAAVFDAEAAGDGAQDSGASLGSKPELLDGPPEDGGDDLKQISGIGPKLEGMLHDLGVWRLDQIASWGPAEIAWVDSNLEGFNGRIERDEWVSQARGLPKGTAPAPAPEADDDA